jgi:hypothetical protein
MSAFCEIWPDARVQRTRPSLPLSPNPRRRWVRGSLTFSPTDVGRWPAGQRGHLDIIDSDAVIGLAGAPCELAGEFASPRRSVGGTGEGRSIASHKSWIQASRELPLMAAEGARPGGTDTLRSVKKRSALWLGGLVLIGAHVLAACSGASGDEVTTAPVPDPDATTTIEAGGRALPAGFDVQGHRGRGDSSPRARFHRSRLLSTWASPRLNSTCTTQQTATSSFGTTRSSIRPSAGSSPGLPPTFRIRTTQTLPKRRSLCVP